MVDIYIKEKELAEREFAILRRTIDLEAPFVIKIQAVRQFLTDFHYFFLIFWKLNKLYKYSAPILIPF